jgi:Tfp pilus assembly protein PilF
VAWASGMYTLLSSLFSLAALNIYVFTAKKMRTSNSEQRTSNSDANAEHPSSLRCSMFDVQCSLLVLILTATLFYILALLTKAASVSLPLAAGVIDVLLLQRPIKKVIVSLGPWILLGIPIVLVAKHFQDVSQINAPPLWGRPWVAMDALGFYLGKIAVPIHLIPDYGRNPNWVMSHPAPVLISVGIASVVLIIAWMARKTLPWLSAGIGLLLVGVSPYLGLTTFDFQYVSTVADRYAYFGLIGLAIIAAGIAIRSRIGSAGLLLVVGLFAVLTHQQVQRWRDTHTLFTYTLQVNDRSLIAHNVFGFIAARDHRPAEAEANYLTALRIWPEDAVIQFNLANLYRKTRPELAIERYGLAVKYQPAMPAYRNSLAAELAITGQAHAAYDQWKQAILIDPDYIDARNNLADLLVNLNRVDEAKQQYQQVLRIDPGNAHALGRLGQLEHSSGK